MPLSRFPELRARCPGSSEWLVQAERHALAGVFEAASWNVATACLSRAVPLVAFAEPEERGAHAHLGRGPVERHALARVSWNASWKAARPAIETLGVPSRRRGLKSAVPTLIWVACPAERHALAGRFV